MRLFDQPHHDGSSLYLNGSTVWLRVPASVGAPDVHVRIVVDGEPRFVRAEVDGSRPGPDVWWRATLPARNPVTPYRFLLGNRWLTAAGLMDRDVTDANDFRLVRHDPPPAWMADAIVYEIFPDRFASTS